MSCVVISQIEMQPGDTILLKRGMQFTGMLAPEGNGTEGNPVRIGTFGEGQRPRIHAKGRHPAGLLLKNKSFWEVQRLEITNTDGNVDWLESFKNQRTQTIAAANGEFDIKSALTQATCFDLANGSAINFDKTS